MHGGKWGWEEREREFLPPPGLTYAWQEYPHLDITGNPKNLIKRKWRLKEKDIVETAETHGSYSQCPEFHNANLFLTEIKQGSSQPEALTKRGKLTPHCGSRISLREPFPYHSCLSTHPQFISTDMYWYLPVNRLVWWSLGIYRWIRQSLPSRTSHTSRGGITHSAWRWGL